MWFDAQFDQKICDGFTHAVWTFQRVFSDFECQGDFLFKDMYMYI